MRAQSSKKPERKISIDELTIGMYVAAIDVSWFKTPFLFHKRLIRQSEDIALLKEYGTDKMIVNSAADWGKSDPLKVPKTGQAMLDAGFSEEEVSLVLFENPINYYAQSGRITIEDVVPTSIDQTQLFEDNSVLRGQVPVVE